MQSENINELAKALSLAQGQMETAKKDSENPFFKSRYADLASVWETCREPLSKNGLAVVQTMDYTETGLNLIITTLMHSSGQWIRGTLAISPVKNDPQSMGSAITYGRRYSLMAIVGIAPADDDAEDAMSRDKPKPPGNSVQPPKPAPEKGKLSDSRIEKIQQISEWLMKIAGDNTEAAVALLQEYTAYKDFKGFRTTKGLESIKNDNRFYAIYKKVEGEYKKFLDYKDSPPPEDEQAGLWEGEA